MTTYRFCGCVTVAAVQAHLNFISPASPPLPLLLAFPADDHGFKIGKIHHRRQETDPDAVDREVTLEDEGTLRVAVERYFPEAAGPMTRAAVCLFTNTPDENFLIDRHPRHEQVEVDWV